MRAHAEVSNSLSGVSGASDNQSVLALGSSQGQLVQSDSLTTSLQDGGLGAGSELQGGNSGLGELQQSVVVGDSANNDNGLVGSTLLAQGAGNSVNRNGGLVDLRQEQRSKDHLVKGSIGTAWRDVSIRDSGLLRRRTPNEKEKKNPFSLVHLQSTGGSFCLPVEATHTDGSLIHRWHSHDFYISSGVTAPSREV